MSIKPEIEYPHAQGYQNFVEQLVQFFPDERVNLEKYVQDIQDVCDQFPRYNLVGGEKYNDDILYINAYEYIQGITQNKKLQSVLSGSNFLYAGIADKTPLYVHALTVNSYIQSSYRCVNGGSQISKLLVKELRKFGAEIYRHTEVSEFCFDGEDKMLTSVKTKNGKQFFAKQFVSNIELKTTINLIGRSRLKNAFIHRVEDLEPISSCFSVYLVLKPKTVPYFNHNFYHYKGENTVWETSNYKAEHWPECYMLSCTQDKHHPDFAESLTAITYMNFNEVKEWESTQNTVANEAERGKSYDDFKARKAEVFITQLEKKIPNLRENIVDIYTSSPLSYRDYIGGYQGNMYGYVKDSHNPLKSIISPKTKIPNLFLTGQTVNMHGILGVTIGAFVTCSEILGKETIDNRLKTALNIDV